jgi:hypothetical protein
MTDLVILVAIVALVVIVGVMVGMIVAGRIDRIISPRPAPPPTVTPGPERPDEEQHP